MIEIDERDLAEIGKVLDALEALHDFGIVPEGGERVRHCVCREASAWRAARKVFVHWREQLGLPVSFRDRF
jgi:hypothetical protein